MAKEKITKVKVVKEKQPKPEKVKKVVNGVMVPHGGKLTQAQVDNSLHIHANLYFILKDNNSYRIVSASINEFKLQKGDLLVGYASNSKTRPLYGFLRIKGLAEDIATLTVEPKSNPSIVAIFFSAEDAYKEFNHHFSNSDDYEEEK